MKIIIGGLIGFAVAAAFSAMAPFPIGTLGTVALFFICIVIGAGLAEQV